MLEEIVVGGFDRWWVLVVVVEVVVSGCSCRC